MAPDERLDRIEGKVDKLVEAMSEMIRFESKIASHQEALARFGMRADDIEQRVEKIEQRYISFDPQRSVRVRVAGRLAMAIATMLRIKARASVSIWPASPMRARLLLRKPPTNSAIITIITRARVYFNAFPATLCE